MDQLGKRGREDQESGLPACAHPGWLHAAGAAPQRFRGSLLRIPCPEHSHPVLGRFAPLCEPPERRNRDFDLRARQPSTRPRAAAGSGGGGAERPSPSRAGYRRRGAGGQGRGGCRKARGAGSGAERGRTGPSQADGTNAPQPQVRSAISCGDAVVRGTMRRRLVPSPETTRVATAHGERGAL
eukprot:5083255-Prymnesium_polylepis.1